STYLNFVRLSTDTYVFEHHGQYDRDYPASQQGFYQYEATAALKLQFQEPMREGEKDAVLDSSFFDREYRDEWQLMVGEDLRKIVVYFVAE
ncbi:hypothetical protein BJ878DRAFT_387750, partial [Calycina marina]